MPSQLNASAHYSIGFKQASFKGIKVPFSGCPVKALSVFEDANLHLRDYTPRTLAVPDNFDKVVYTEDGNFLVECFGQLKNLGGDDKHGLCIYLVTNKSTNEKHALIGFAGQGFSNFNGSDKKKFGKYTISVDGDTSDTIVKLRNPCSELGFHTAKALSIFASLHRLTKGEVEVKIKVGDAEEVCCINSFEDFPAFKKVLQSTKPSDTKKATGPANMPIPREHFLTVIDEWEARAPAVMLRCLLYKCADYKFYDLVVDLYTRCIKLGVAPDNIRWAEIDPFGDVTWGVGLQSEKTCSILETAAVYLAKHGVDKFPGKNLMGNCLHDLTVILRNPATGEFCCDDELDEIFEKLGDESDKCFIQLVPDIFWKGDYAPKPAAADVGTSLQLPLQSDEKPDCGLQDQAPLELELALPLGRPVTPDYNPNSPSYVPTSPVCVPTSPSDKEHAERIARLAKEEAERVTSAIERAREIAYSISSRTVAATDNSRRASGWFQVRLIEDAEELLAKIKEACPVAVELMENYKKEKLEAEMQAQDEEVSTTIGRDIAMQLADVLPEAIRMAMKPGVCDDYKNDVIQMAEDLIKAVKLTHPLLSAGDILFNSDEEGRPAKRARQGSNDSYGRPASASRVRHASPIHASDLEELANAPSSPEETPEDA